LLDPVKSSEAGVAKPQFNRVDTFINIRYYQINFKTARQGLFFKSKIVKKAKGISVSIYLKPKT